MTERTLITAPQALPAGELGAVAPEQQKLNETETALAQLIADPARLDAMDKDKLDWLYQTSEKIRKERARLAFEAAFAEVQLDCEPVRRRAVNAQYKNKYAKLEDVVHMLEPVLKKHGFTYRFPPEKSQQEDYMTMVLVVTHVPSGHTERAILEAPLDYKGPKGAQAKTKIHGMGSTFRYCERYLLCGYFAIVMADEDDDGVAGGAVGPGAEVITDTQLNFLRKLSAFAGLEEARLCKVYGLTNTANMPKNLYGPARQLLMSKVGMTQNELIAWKREYGVAE